MTPMKANIPVAGAGTAAPGRWGNGVGDAEAEFISGSTQTQGAIPLQFEGTHAHIAHIHFSTHGIVR